MRTIIVCIVVAIHGLLLAWCLRHPTPQPPAPIPKVQWVPITVAAEPAVPSTSAPHAPAQATKMRAPSPARPTASKLPQPAPAARSSAQSAAQAVEPTETAPIPSPPAPISTPVPASTTTATTTSAEQAPASAHATAAAPAASGVQASSAPSAPSSDPEAPASPPLFNAAYLHNPAPIYPSAARELRESGRVLLRVQVSAQGLAEQVTLAQSSGSPRLDQAALRAVRQWRFVPAQRGGTALAGSVLVPISFHLNED